MICGAVTPFENVAPFRSVTPVIVNFLVWKIARPRANRLLYGSRRRCARNPAARYGSVDALAEDIAALLESHRPECPTVSDRGG